MAGGCRNPDVENCVGPDVCGLGSALVLWVPLFDVMMCVASESAVVCPVDYLGLSDCPDRLAMFMEVEVVSEDPTVNCSLSPGCH